MQNYKRQETSHSYTLIPLNLRLNEKKSEFINSKYLSIPHGSEHTSFVHMRKNMYEDALFKAEDERYDFDINLKIFNKVIEILSKSLQSDNNDVTFFDETLNQVLEYRVLQNLYCVSLKDFLEKYKERNIETKKRVLLTFYNRIQSKKAEIIMIKD